jgi:hypothetical protein
MKLPSFLCFSVYILSALSLVSAKAGRVAIREVDEVYTDGLSHMVDSYKARNKTVEFKTIDEWNDMSAIDFEQYDALVLVAFDCPSENPFSNSIMWSSAVEHGNSIIMGTSDLSVYNSANVKEVIDSAVEFTLSGHGTGSFISIGQMTETCLEVNGTAWISEAFNDEFHIRSILPSNYWKNRLVARHFAFNSVTEAMVKTVPNSALILPIFTQYPEEWYPLVVNTKTLGSWTSFISDDGSIVGAPTILMKGIGVLMPGETMFPSSAPTEVPSVFLTEIPSQSTSSSPSYGRKTGKSSSKDDDGLFSGSTKASKKRKKGSKSAKIRLKSTKG